MQRMMTPIRKLSFMNKIIDYKGRLETKGLKRKVALEHSRRIFKCLKKLIQFTSGLKMFNIIFPILANLPYEEFWILYFNRSNGLVDKSFLSKDKIPLMVVDVRLALKKHLNLELL